MARFVAQVPVRWTDQDAYRHVNHAKAVTLLEEARVAMIFDAAAAEGVGSFAAGLLVVGLHVDYRRQIPYRSDGLRVSMAIEEVRAASFRITYEMHDGPAEADAGRRPGVDPDGHARPRRRAAAPARPPDERDVPRPLDGGMSSLHVPDPDDRGDLGTFVGRVVRLDQTAVVRLRAAAAGPGDGVGGHALRRARHPHRARHAGARRRHDLRRRAALGADRGPRRHRRPRRRRAVAGPAPARRRAGPSSTPCPPPSWRGSPSAASPSPGRTPARSGRPRRCWTRPC